jgi:hypothetical protein
MTSPCPCGAFQFPQATCNASGLPALSYRVGDFTSFRYELLVPLQPQPGATWPQAETELTAWRPGASGDLAMQMVEWWAYLADILTFYNERIANEAYLGTALLPESVNHLVQLLGYRPKPALGSKGQVAALLTPSARPPMTVPAGLQIQSKPGPGQQPQVFEVEQATTVGLPDLVIADVVPSDLPLLDASGSTFWLAGKVTSLKAGDRLLLANATAITAQTLGDWAWIKIGGTTPGTDPLGNTVTQVAFSTVSGSLDSGAQAAKYVLLKPQQFAPLWPYAGAMPISSATADLAQIARGLGAGSLVLFDLPDGAAPPVIILEEAETETSVESEVGRAEPRVLVKEETTPAEGFETESTFEREVLSGGAAETFRGVGGLQPHPAPVAPSSSGLFPTPGIVTSYSEVVWYANGSGPTPPSPSPPAVPIGIPHAEIGFASTTLSGTSWPWVSNLVTVRWSWLQIGTIVGATTAASYNYTGGGSALVADPSSPNPMPVEATAVPVMVEDAAGDAAATTLTSSGAPATASLGTLSPAPANGFSSPLDIFFNLVPVSRGKTVVTETLGSGNPMVAGQDFTLAQSPVTYFFDPASTSGPNFTSTVGVSVNGVEWQEVQSFYGQPKNAQIFVLHEDDQSQTHVSFGDGVNGSLLPTGTSNVIATYRYGAGAAAPDPETLTVVLTPTPGLKGVANPLAPTGGSDADQPSQLRSLAPQSVLTFNRAVSLDDYAAIALTAAGVTQAVASYAFDSASQRPAVVLWIAGDDNATAAAQAALAGTEMPGQRVIYETAVAINSILSLTYVRDPRYADSAVHAGLMSALADQTSGLFAPANVGIGQPIYQSQIAAACLAVQGVVAIQDVDLSPEFQFLSARRSNLRFRSSFLPLNPTGCSGQVFNPGAGAYFVVPDDTTHVALTGSVAS